MIFVTVLPLMPESNIQFGLLFQGDWDTTEPASPHPKHERAYTSSRDLSKALTYHSYNVNRHTTKRNARVTLITSTFLMSPCAAARAARPTILIVSEVLKISYTYHDCNAPDMGIVFVNMQLASHGIGCACRDDTHGNLGDGLFVRVCKVSRNTLMNKSYCPWRI